MPPKETGFNPVQVGELERLTRQLHERPGDLCNAITQIEQYGENNPNAGIPDTPEFVVELYKWAREIERIAQA